MSVRAAAHTSDDALRLGTATDKQFAQRSWFSEAWSAAKQFVKGEYDGPAAMLLDVALGMVPVVGQAIDARDIILGLIDVSEQPDHYEAWFNFITAVIGVVPGGGDAVKRALRSVKKGGAPANELLSMLRGLGRGNTEQAVLDMLDTSKLKPHIQALTETLKNNRLVEALDASTRQRVIVTANRLQNDLPKQFGRFADEVRTWLKKQPNNAAEADYVSKTVAKKAEKPDVKGDTASETKEHSSVGHAGRANIFYAAVAELTQSRIFFKGVLGEHMADYWVIEQGWAHGWREHDWGMDGNWPALDQNAPRKLNDGGSMTPLWPLVPRGRGIDALWRTNGKNGKPYAVIEAKSYADPTTSLGAMLADRQDKQEYEDFKQKMRDWKAKRASGRGRSGKRSGKVDQQTKNGDSATSSSPPEKPEPRTMQMSHLWIEQRLHSALKNDPWALADLRVQRQGKRAYSRHVLLFSVPDIFDHSIAVWEWFMHSKGNGPAPKDSDHASHKATRTFGDAELAAEERHRNVSRTAKTRGSK